ERASGDSDDRLPTLVSGARHDPGSSSTGRSGCAPREVSTTTHPSSHQGRKPMTHRVVMYYPERGDPKLGQPYSADLMPLEFLRIIPLAREAGFEFDVIDSMVEPDPMGKLWEKLEGAFAFASTCIVGY